MSHKLLFAVAVLASVVSLTARAESEIEHYTVTFYGAEIYRDVQQQIVVANQDIYLELLQDIQRQASYCLQSMASEQELNRRFEHALALNKSLSPAG